MRLHHSSITRIPKTFILCHKGSNYNILQQLTFQGANVALIEPFPKRDESSYTNCAASEICRKMNRDCVNVFQCDIHNSKHIKQVLTETKETFGRLDGIVLYDEYKWDYSCLMYTYMNFVKKGQISIVDPETNIIQNDESFR